LKDETINDKMCCVCMLIMCYIDILPKFFKMNNLYDLYLTYQGKRNIFREVEEFRKQEFQSRNFQAVMEWLKLSDLVYKNKVTFNLIMKTER